MEAESVLREPNVVESYEEILSGDDPSIRLRQVPQVLYVHLYICEQFTIANSIFSQADNAVNTIKIFVDDHGRQLHSSESETGAYFWLLKGLMTI